MTRRAFLSGIAASAGAMAAGQARAAADTAAAQRLSMSVPGPPSAAEGAGEFRLSNELAEFIFDPGTGALREIRTSFGDRSVNLEQDPSGEDLRIWLGSLEEPNLRVAVIAPHQRQDAAFEVTSHSGGASAWIRIDNLHDLDGQPTGLACEQRLWLDQDSSGLLRTVRVVNNGEMAVTGMRMGIGGLRLPGDPSNHVLTAPTGYMGTQWRNPAVEFAGESAVFSMPPTAPMGMVCGWVHLAGEGAGIGTGYLNRRSMDIVAEASFNDHPSLGWRVFRYRGAWIFMDDINGPLQVYPLRPGEDFVSDPWFISIDDGDWHRTAALYRAEYEKAFEGDFLRWEDTAPAVRKCDLIFNLTAAWGKRISEDNVHDLSAGEVRNRFLDVPPKVEAAVKDLGIKPEHTLVVVLGQATHWGIYKLPDYFPVNAEAGGPSDFKEMIRRLRKDVGVSGTHFYAHAAFNHPDADNYAVDADTGWSANLYANYDHLGRIACMDSQGWWKLWRDKIIPGFVEAGASGVEFDEGFGHHFICSKDGHIHGTSSESVLTAQPRGALRIFRECRRALGPDGYIECEGGSDIGARHIDLWESSVAGPIEIVRYTHPDKLITAFWAKPEDVNRAFVYGLPIIVSLPITNEEFRTLLKRYIELRNEIRKEAAPGYPDGFRDRDGISDVPDGVIAKTFRSPDGITVAYYSPAGAEGSIAVHGEALGHPRRNTDIRVSLKPQEAGFRILRKG